MYQAPAGAITSFISIKLSLNSIDDKGKTKEAFDGQLFKVWSAVVVEMCVVIGKQMSFKEIVGKVDSANHMTRVVLIQLKES